MAGVKINIIANAVGNALSSMISFVFIPLYVQYLGGEAYGLVGFFAAMSGVLAILDFGIGATIGREFAKINIAGTETKEILDTFKTFEYIAFATAALIFCSTLAFSYPVAKYWLNTEALSVETTQSAIILMGAVIAVRWPNTIYQAALVGMEKQVLINIVNFVYALFSAGGVFLFLHYFGRTVTNYFSWQLFAVLCLSTVSRYMVHRVFARYNYTGHFSKKALLRQKSYTIGIGITALLSAIFTQLDKVVLSKMLTLEAFGQYAIASAVASILLKFIYPVTSAITPRLVQLVHQGNESAIVRFYHQCAQFIAALVIPVGLALIIFSYDLILIWTSNAQLAQNIWLATSVLATGTLFNGLINVPYALQIAYGYTRILWLQNLIGGIVLVPFLLVLSYQFGMVGAACVWLLINLGYLTISQYFLHRRLLLHEYWPWLLQDVLIPLFACAAWMLFWRYQVSKMPEGIWKLALILIVSFTGMLITVFVMPKLRSELSKTIKPKLGYAE